MKLYFMIGLPTEKEEDLAGIGELISEISDLKREIDGKRAHITASINAFVPKPHSAFERQAMDGLESLEIKKDKLKRYVKPSLAELDFHSFHMSYLEAVLSRGDRRLSGAIYEAWKAGARFDGWQDKFNFDIWLGAFKKLDIDPAFYATRLRGPDELLPWEFLG